MIDQAHVDQGERFLHPCGDQLVGLARLLDARRVLGFVLECHLAILASRLVLTSE